MPSAARQPLTLPKGRGRLTRHHVEDLRLTLQFDNQDPFAIGIERSFGKLVIAEPHLGQFRSLSQYRAEPQAMGFLALCIAAVQMQGRGERGQ